MLEVVIVLAARTAVGNFNGQLGHMPAHQLGKVLLQNIVSVSGINPADISEVILGQVLTAGCGQNPARQASILAGIPENVSAWNLNHVCGSGLKSIILAAQNIALGHSNIVIAGGQESMSQAKHAMHLRSGIKMGNSLLIDTMLSDGLTDAFAQTHMGITAENVATRYKISRQEQDEFAFHSQSKAAIAQKNNKFKDEIVPITIDKKEGSFEFKADEFIKSDVTIEKLSKLKTAFKQDGTVTAGNASGINDGAAVLLLMSKDEAIRRNLKPIASIKSYAASGVDPSIMGVAPIEASKKALHLANWQHSELDLIESNEAFASTSIAVNKEIGWDVNKVNVNGGAIAIGHPIGASGARILVTLLHEMKRSGAKKGLATLCIGGGMGLAMCIEKI